MKNNYIKRFAMLLLLGIVSIFGTSLANAQARSDRGQQDKQPNRQAQPQQQRQPQVQQQQRQPQVQQQQRQPQVQQRQVQDRAPQQQEQRRVMDQQRQADVQRRQGQNQQRAAQQQESDQQRRAIDQQRQTDAQQRQAQGRRIPTQTQPVPQREVRNGAFRPTDRQRPDNLAWQRQQQAMQSRLRDRNQNWWEQRERFLQQQRRTSQWRFEQGYWQRLQQDRIRLQGFAFNDYGPPIYRYYRGGQYFEINQYGGNMLRHAVSLGYDEGYRAGMADRQDGWTLDYQNSDAFQDGTLGYDGYYADLGEYQFYFRQGFQRGYEDGYYGRFQYGAYSNGSYNVLGDVMNLVLDLQRF